MKPAEQWKENGKRMLTWFADLKQLPPAPVQINRFTRITDLNKFLSSQRAIIEGNIDKPLNRVFHTAYLRLYNLKKFIEKK